MNLNKIISTIVLNLVLLINATAQNSPATIISYEGDTLRGEIEVPSGSWWKGTTSMEIDYISLQKGTVLIDEKGTEHKIKPDNYKLIVIEYKGDPITMVSMKKIAKMGSLFATAFAPYTFLKKEISGAMNLYTYYMQNNSGYNPATGGTMNYGSHVVEREFIEKNGELHYIRRLGFKSKMMELCSDKPDLINKIENNTYRKNDLYAIVKEYNTNVSQSDQNNNNKSTTTNISNKSIRISVNPVYGTYNMNAMKKFQDELYENANTSVGVPMALTNDFPGYYGYEVNLALNIEKLELGLMFASRSTGGRISYSDYSGKYNIDNYLKDMEVAVNVGYQALSSDRLELSINGTAGLAFTEHTLSSIFQLEGDSEQNEKYEFSSTNAILGPSLKLRYYPLKFVFVEVIGRYDLHISGKLAYSKNKEVYLEDSNDDLVRANWSGFRAGAGLGFRF